MNIMIVRRFALIISSMVSLFLFVTGFVILSSIINADENSDDGLSNLLDLEEHMPKTDPFNVLFLVGDQEEYNTDTMLLVNYNPEKSSLNILSLPRDTMVKFEGYYIPKLNSVYSTGGTKKTCETVSNLLNVNIKYYVYINLKTFRQIIDTLGGVDFYVPVDLKYDDPTQNLHIDIKKGMHHMDGKMAEEFLRFRKPNGPYTKELLEYYDGSDLKRIEMQIQFIKEVIRQKAKLYNISKINSVVNVVLKNMKTNITLSEILQIAPSVPRMKPENIKAFRLDGKDGIVDEIWYFLYNGRVIDLSTKKVYKTENIIPLYFSSEAGVSRSTVSEEQRTAMYKFTPADPSPVSPSPVYVEPTPSPTTTPPSPEPTGEDSDEDGWDWEDNPSNDGSFITPDPSGEG